MYILHCARDIQRFSPLRQVLGPGKVTGQVPRVLKDLITRYMVKSERQTTTRFDASLRVSWATGCGGERVTLSEDSHKDLGIESASFGECVAATDLVQTPGEVLIRDNRFHGTT